MPGLVFWAEINSVPCIHNEAIASLMAYKVANRPGITSVEGGQADVTVIFSLAAGASSDDEAMGKLIGYYRLRYPRAV